MNTTLPPPTGSGQPFESTETFAERYCARHGLERAAFVNTVLQETLYPHARLFRWALPWSSLAVDRAFVDNVGRVRRAEEFHNEVRDFFEDPTGRTWLRDRLHLRVSVRRLRRLVRETFETEGPAARLDVRTVSAP